MLVPLALPLSSLCLHTIAAANYTGNDSPGISELLGAFWNILSFGVLPLELDNETSANVAEMTGAAPFDGPVMASGHMIQRTSTRKMENRLFVPFPLILFLQRKDSTCCSVGHEPRKPHP